MALVDRVKSILVTPRTEWGVIATEPASSGALVTGYVVPLAAVSAAAGLVGSLIVGAAVRAIVGGGAGFFGALIGACVAVVFSVIGAFVLSIIINLLAPTFGGQKDDVQALKVAAYSLTAVWVAGIAQVVPILGMFVVFLGGLYGIFLMYLGLSPLMKAPEDKTPVYTLVVVVCMIVLGFVIFMFWAAVLGMGMLGSSMLGGSHRTSSSSPAASTSKASKADPNSALGKLEAFGNKLEESTKKMDAAEKSGDTNAQVAAALEGLGTLLGGGKRVDPVSVDLLKPFVPETFAGLAKESSSAEKTGLASLMVSKAQATYGDGAQKHVTLEVSDTGGVSGLVGLASWVGVQGEHEDSSGSERTRKVNGRLEHEKISNNGGSNEYALVLGDRFIVSASGRGIDTVALKSAVASLDLAKLESMKDMGVQK
jgi:hypothetical protein